MSWAVGTQPAIPSTPQGHTILWVCPLPRVQPHPLACTSEHGHHCLVCRDILSSWEVSLSLFKQTLRSGLVMLCDGCAFRTEIKTLACPG